MTTEDFPHVVPWSSWSEQQLSFVRYLTKRLAKDETALNRVRDLADEYASQKHDHYPGDGHHACAACWVDDIRHALDPEDKA